MHTQRGFSLIEAMVALLVGSVLGLGTAMIAAKSLLINRDTNVQSLVTMNMRYELQKQESEACSANISLSEGVEIPISCVESPENYTVKLVDSAGADVLVGSTAIKYRSALTGTTDVLTGDPIKVTP